MSSSPIHPTALRCEYQENPLGIDTRSPRFSWQLAPLLRGQRQSAYRILVASSEEKLRAGQGDLWDSGKVDSDQSVLVPYDGAALESRRRAWWKVRIWDKDGQESPDSPPAWFEMGLLDKADWQAQWISLPNPPDRNGPCPHLRREFALCQPVRKARAYASALGLYELFVNGKAVTEDRFLPGWTDYNKRAQYQTFDITALLIDGGNALGMILADGWYCGPLGFKAQVTSYADHPEGLVQIEIEYADGSRETLISDPSWKAATGPILTSTLYNGETYDSRLAMPRWAEAGFDDHAWAPALARPIGDIALSACPAPPVRAVEELAPISLAEPEPGAFVFDLGQNMVGWARLKWEGRAGETITLRFAEMLNPDGTIYTTNLRGAEATDRYTFAEDGVAHYEPRFTFHGFRYVEMTGCDRFPTKDAITGIVAHSDLPITGAFECSSPLLNQLQKNILWGQRGNFLDVPTDCPQRDERLGWMGDAQVFARTACFNMDTAAFFTKWLRDVVDAQSAKGGFPDVAPRIVDFSDGAPAWGDAGVIVPWVVYSCYGDRRLLEEMYEPMARWIASIHEANPDFLWLNRRNNDFGDWLNIDSPTPKDLIATAYFAHDADLMAHIARVLEKGDDAARYAELFENIRTAFCRRFLGEDGRLAGDTQTAYVLALRFDLLPEKMRPLAASHLAEDIKRRSNTLSTGFIGTGLLLPALTEAGYLELAYELALSECFPSWGYSIRHGATTMWERWDGWTEEKGFQTPEMNSFNHYAFGAIGEWLYGTVAGIDLDPADPGYKHVILKPQPGGGLTWARATYRSAYGEIASDWKIENGAFSWRIVVPVNTRATAYVPASGADVTQSGRPAGEAEGVEFVGTEHGRAVFRVPSGEYQFRAPLP